MTSRKQTYIGVLFLIVAAVAAGVAGASLVAREIAGTLIPSAPAPLPERAAPPKVNLDRVTESMRSTVSFYRARAGDGSVLDAALLPADRVGSGLILTSDGWLMTAASVLSVREPLVIAFADRTVTKVDASKAVRDTATGLVFVRVEATRLPVSPFGDDVALRAGELVYAAYPTEVRTVTVTSRYAIPAQNKNDLLESTEILARRMLIDAQLQSGSVIVNGRGDVVGMVTRDGEAVPASFVTGILKNIFRGGKALRPRAGMRYVSNDLVLGAPPPSTGALITGAGRVRAVERGSAAESAGLREGDVIIAVERDRVDADGTLAEILNQYAPGAIVELNVLRAGEEKKISLTLK